MSKILGLDLGTNSIGWALINTDFSIDSVGTRIFPSQNSSLNIERAKKRSYRRLQNRKTIRNNNMVSELLEIQQELIKNLSKKRGLNIDIKYILCVLLTASMFTCAYILKSNWQFWLNLGIGGLFILLNMKYRKDKSD